MQEVPLYSVLVTMFATRLWEKEVILDFRRVDGKLPVERVVSDLK